MSAIKPAVPYLIDPIGTLVTKHTGIPTPGGLVDRKLNPPNRPAQQKPADTAKPPMPQAPRVPTMTGPRVPPAGPSRPASDKSGVGPGSDATRGMLAKRGGAGKSLLS